MRILFLNNYAHVTGGADRHVLELAALLEGTGHEVRFVCSMHETNGPVPGVFVPLHVTHATRDQITGRAAARIAVSALWNRTAYAATGALIRSWRPDLVHVHKLYPQLSASCVVAAAQAGVPVIQTAHDYEFYSADVFDPEGSWRSKAEASPRYRAVTTGMHLARLGLHRPRVTQWIAVSRHTAGRYAAHGIDATPMANFTMQKPSGDTTGVGRSGVVFIGRLSPEKGVDDLLSLARLLPDTPFRIAGSGPLAGDVENASRQLGNVEFLGPLSADQVGKAFRSARVAVMPSQWEEPGPLACLEAMAAGTPVVAYETAGGLAEYIRDPAAGLVVERSIRSLHEATSALLTDDELWRTKSASGPRAINLTHCPRRYTEKIEEIYRRAAAR